MKKYIITENQLRRLETIHALLAREIRQNSEHQKIEDESDFIDYLNKIAMDLLATNQTKYELSVTGGKFVWIPDEPKMNHKDSK